MDFQSIDSILAYMRDNMATVTYKSLRKDEPDPPTELKLDHMQRLLVGDPGLFLTRWGRFLPRDKVALFEPLRGESSCSWKHIISLLLCLLPSWLTRDNDMHGTASSFSILHSPLSSRLRSKPLSLHAPPLLG